MFQNFGHYSSGQPNQEHAYIQAMYRQQYDHEQTLRASPSWTGQPVGNCASLTDEAIAYSTGHSRLAAASLQSTAVASTGSPMASTSSSAAQCTSRGGGPTPDSYFRNPAAINGLHPYSYAAEAAAAAAAACAWAGRLEHPAAGGLATGAPGFPGLSSQAAAFRRSGESTAGVHNEWARPR